MVPDSLAVPQFQAVPATEQAPPAPATDHSDETMSRLRHPFDAQPATPATAPRAAGGR